ncbi:MAG: hypothetical protein ACRDRO_11780 [Pseudonocardiaceae bacterium]
MSGLSIWAQREDRHASVVAAARWFTDGTHLPAGLPQETTQLFTRMARELVMMLPDDTELTAALRKLRESKDCAVALAVEVGGAS